MPEIKKLRKKISEVEIDEDVDEMWVRFEDDMYKAYPSGVVVSIEEVRVITPPNFESELKDLDIGQCEFDVSVSDIDVQTSNFSPEITELDIDELEDTFTVKDVKASIADPSSYRVSFSGIEIA